MKLLLSLIVAAALIAGGLYVWIHWPEYENDEFSIRYPRSFSVEAGEGLGGSILTPSVVKISAPENAFDSEGTNFGEAYVVVSASSDSDSELECTQFTDVVRDTDTPIPSAAIGGVTFGRKDVAEAAAGNLYTSRLYRTLQKGKCYELALTVHTGNIYNYPEGTVTEFNKETAFEILEAIAQTFRFSNEGAAK